MTQEEGEKKSGCSKWLGCGCLALMIIAVAVGISGWMFMKKMRAPREAHAGHFVPENISGWGQANLQKADEGMSDLHRFIIAEMQQHQPEQEGIAGMLQGLFRSAPDGKATPIGPRLTGWVLPTEDPVRPQGVLVVDLNTINKITATTLQLTFSTLMGGEAQKRNVGGISLYENPKTISYLSHKGFLVLSENAAALEDAAHRYLENKRNHWPTLTPFISHQDLHIQWTGDFETFNTFTTDWLGIANPKDGDFQTPAQGLKSIDLDADVVSADQLHVILTANTETVKDAQRVKTDLAEHAAELQQRLSTSNLLLDFTADAAGTTATLNASLTGLKEWISGQISEMFEPR